MMYSAILWQHAQSPLNRGDLHFANARSKAAYPPCGDKLELLLHIVDGRILRSCFQAGACHPVVAVASVGTQLLVGKTVAEARMILPSQLDQALGGIPIPKRHAILLFIQALHQALDAFNEESEDFENV